VVASLQHGNTFPLVNGSVLFSAGVIPRPNKTFEGSSSLRATMVSVTFIAPSSPEDVNPSGILMACLVITAELIALIVVIGIRRSYEMYFGASLILCIFISLSMQYLLCRIVAFRYAHAEAIEKDQRRAVARGAALDVHVIVKHWNTSEIDVLVGYSAELRALTNLPIAIH
jgi:hypothetical protein